ncbi:MAG TPA: hypothetical protein VGY58_05770 [Gemmataceae bacterium]|jgi:hypothetical protein|nr:hypothetical protein [Gemmataceae bacterium]
MTQQEMENEIKALKVALSNEINKLAATCHDLASQFTALRKRVRQIEVDYYKDLEEEDEREG